MTALKNKTVILVTHQVEFLSEVDQILVTNMRILRILFRLLFIYCTSHIDIYLPIVLPGNGRWTNYSVRKLQ